ncbi:hypothetical protein QQF64_007783 [Cirrhinus molitorella]|uniref:Uncharacterized protein n=1 Tax=Cirrhinus molitorella TaxID=172907 RepID=A0ABR3MFQ2_9TELE
MAEGGRGAGEGESDKRRREGGGDSIRSSTHQTRNSKQSGPQSRQARFLASRRFVNVRSSHALFSPSICSDSVECCMLLVLNAAMVQTRRWRGLGTQGKA